MTDRITVHKLDDRGNEIWRYHGQVLNRTASAVRLLAAFDRPPIQVGPLDLETGDLFLETFYHDRWYNHFAVFSIDNSAFRGWYCNIARPARILENRIYQEDLALDLVVLPEGESTVLDREEFEALNLPPDDRAQALQALHHLQGRAASSFPPFDKPPPLP